MSSNAIRRITFSGSPSPDQLHRITVGVAPAVVVAVALASRSESAPNVQAPPSAPDPAKRSAPVRVA